MKENKSYLVMYSKGQVIERWKPIYLFTTHDKAYADAYVEKFNRIRKHYLDYYTQFANEFTGILKNEYREKYYTRYYRLAKTWEAEIVELDNREVK